MKSNRPIIYKRWMGKQSVSSIVYLNSTYFEFENVHATTLMIVIAKVENMYNITSYKPVRITSITCYIVTNKRDSLRSIFYHVTNGPLRKVSANKAFAFSWLWYEWSCCSIYLEMLTCNQCMQLWCPFLLSVCLKGPPNLCTWKYMFWYAKSRHTNFTLIART